MKSWLLGILLAFSLPFALVAIPAVMRLNFLPLVFLALSSAALADHACIEELPNGTVLKRTDHLPQEWLLVGGKSLIEPSGDGMDDE